MTSNILQDITQACRSLLLQAPEAQETRQYLDARLCATSQEQFQFGFFPASHQISLLTDLVDIASLQEHKLLYTRIINDALGPRQIISSYFEHYPLIMPFHNSYGQVAGFVARTLLSEADRKIHKLSKYKNSPQSQHFKKGNMLFGLSHHKQAIRQHQCVYVVEGQFDVIKASQIGFHHMVAVGNSNMTAYQLAVISRYTNTIFLLFDNDEAGDKGRKSIIGKFQNVNADIHIHNIYLPEDYKDIDELITQTGITSYSDIPFVSKG